MSSSRGGNSRRPGDGDDVIDFVQTFCRLTKGDRAGQTITLQGWQQALLRDMFTLRTDGTRQYRTALVGLGRKNGKSLIGSCLGLYGLVADGEPGAEVYSCAGDRQQARIVFGEAKKMVQLDPDLSRELTLYKDAIEFKRTGGIYRVLSADADLQQGLNPSFVVFDEVHVQPDEDLWNTMVLGMGTRRQPYMIGITTAGYDEDTLLGRLYKYGKRVNSGEITDPEFLFRWWEASEGCDWHDEREWHRANPSMAEGTLRIEALRADARTTPEHEFRRYHLNMWTATADAWLPYGAWDACRDDSLTLDAALPLFVGVDVALRNDSTAVVCAQKQTDRIVVRSKVWENPYPEGDPRHAEWKLNIFEVEEHLKELRQRFPEPACEIDGDLMPGPEFSYDPAYFHRSAAVLEGEGLAMVEYPQHDSRMIPASQGLYQLVAEGRLAHDGDATLKRHVENASAEQKPRGWRLTKPKGSRRKIDAAIALAIAAHRAETASAAAGPSIYETESLLVI